MELETQLDGTIVFNPSSNNPSMQKKKTTTLYGIKTPIKHNLKAKKRERTLSTVVFWGKPSALSEMSLVPTRGRATSMAEPENQDVKPPEGKTIEPTWNTRPDIFKNLHASNVSFENL